MKIPLLLAGLASPVSAATFYVNSATGSDGNPGTAAALFQSFYKFAQIAVQPGDTIRFAAGTSYSGYFEFTPSGAAGRPITLTSYGSGPAPVFTNPDQWYAIRLTGDYLTLRGVKLMTIPATFSSIRSSRRRTSAPTNRRGAKARQPRQSRRVPRARLRSRGDGPSLNPNHPNPR